MTEAKEDTTGGSRSKPESIQFKLRELSPSRVLWAENKQAPAHPVDLLRALVQVCVYLYHEPASRAQGARQLRRPGSVEADFTLPAS